MLAIPHNPYAFPALGIRAGTILHLVSQYLALWDGYYNALETKGQIVSIPVAHLAEEQPLLAGDLMDIDWYPPNGLFFDTGI